MTFAEKLRKARQDAGMTQKDLSQKSIFPVRMRHMTPSPMHLG